MRLGFSEVVALAGQYLVLGYLSDLETFVFAAIPSFSPSGEPFFPKLFPKVVLCSENMHFLSFLSTFQ